MNSLKKTPKSEKPRPKAKVRAPFILGDFEIKAGERKTVNLPIAELYTANTLSMSVHVIHGKKEGPVLFVSACIHGDEINGVEVITRLLKLKSLQHLKGTLLIIPVVNIFGFLNNSRYLPDRRDLNRSFPGSQHGSMASRLANLFNKEIVQRSTHGIDLHTAAIHRNNLPQLRVDLNDTQALEMANTFGVPVILHSPVIEGTLRQMGQESQVPILVYECGEALRFDELSIRAGVRGVISAMRHLEMLPKRHNAPRIKTIITRSSTWVRAPRGGILRTRITLGKWVEKDQIMGTIGSPLDEVQTEVVATKSGIIIGKTELPLVDEGNAIFHIAMLEEEEVVPLIAQFKAMGASDEWSMANL